MTTSTTTRRWQEVTPWLRLAGTVIARMVLGVVAGLALWAVALVPLGHAATITASGSMTPSIGVGDVVVVRAVDPGTEVLGRVVTADNPAKPGTLLTHRVVFDNHDGTYQTKGDANRDRDAAPVPRENIKGRGFLLVPWIGLPAHWASTGQIVPLAVTVAGLGLLVAIARDPQAQARPARDQSARGQSAGDHSARHRFAGNRAARPDRAPRLRVIGATGLVMALLGGTAALLPAALARSSAGYTGNTRNVANTWATNPCPTTFPYTFETDMICWTGEGQASGPVRTVEWKSQGNWSLKADFVLGSGNKSVYLMKAVDQDLSQYKAISANVSRSLSGFHGTGTMAKIYVKWGPAWTWYDGGISVGPVISDTIIPGGTKLNLDLSGLTVAQRQQVREIGVQYVAASNSSLQTTVYVDNITATAALMGRSAASPAPATQPAPADVPPTPADATPADAPPTPADVPPAPAPAPPADEARADEPEVPVATKAPAPEPAVDYTDGTVSAKVTVTSIPAGGFIALTARMDGQTYDRLALYADRAELQAIRDGEVTKLAGISLPVEVGRTYTLSLVEDGTTVSATVDNVKVGSGPSAGTTGGSDTETHQAEATVTTQ